MVLLIVIFVGIVSASLGHRQNAEQHRLITRLRVVLIALLIKPPGFGNCAVLNGGSQVTKGNTESGNRGRVATSWSFADSVSNAIPRDRRKAVGWVRDGNVGLARRENPARTSGRDFSCPATNRAPLIQVRLTR
jgi:hypothetical protein